MSVSVTDLRVLVRCALIRRASALTSKHKEAARAELAVVQDNPAAWHDPIKFEISYACYISLKHDLEWRVTYVGSAEDESFDQELDSVCVGPIHPGQYKFVFQVDPPDINLIPRMEAIGVTVILLTCSYNGKASDCFCHLRAKEFIRVGYYVNNEYSDEELRQNPPEKPRLDKVTRNILADKPRVTRFEHEFDNEQAAAANAIPDLGSAAPALTHDQQQNISARQDFRGEPPPGDAIMVGARM